jgi:hypothetical protein
MSPGPRAWSFQTCVGSTTTQDRSRTRGIVLDRAAFRFDDSVGVPIGIFRNSIPSPPVPLFTLHRAPRGAPCKTRGRVVRLFLSRKALASSTPCRFIPAHNYFFSLPTTISPYPATSSAAVALAYVNLPVDSSKSASLGVTISRLP